GRILQVSVLKGPAKELDLWPLMIKRLTHVGSTLRSRTSEEKAAIIAELEQTMWPHIEAGRVKPQVYRTFALETARGAHELLD
ncbi:zinc-binding dehydrogenase, partial [Clostridioides difficile]|nr:zinc-binding dehydrogenase [Clostridioides difficile]